MPKNANAGDFEEWFFNKYFAHDLPRTPVGSVKDDLREVWNAACVTKQLEIDALHAEIVKANKRIAGF